MSRRIVPALHIRFMLHFLGLASLLTSQSVPPLSGIWEGVLEVPGARLRLVLKVTSGAEGLKATLDSLDQGALNLSVDSITVQDAAVTFEMKAIGGGFRGRLNATATELAGSWSQSGSSFRLVFHRSEKAPEMRRPQEPKPPYPYEEREVTYENKSGGVKLAGTLTLPRSRGPFPALILVSGSGPQDRNETVFGHRPFLVLADALTRCGVAVLRSDDRGVGGSTGNIANATSEDLAGDVLAGIELLKTIRQVDSKRIGLLGHSEGGLTAPLVAIRSSDVAFLVLIAPPGIPGEQILYAQAEAIAKASGADAEAIERNRRQQERIFAVVKSSSNSTAVAPKVRKERAAEMTESEKKAGHQSFEAQLKTVLSPWFRFFLTYDPARALRRIRCPVLVIYGERDLQVLPSQNARVVETALRAGGNKSCKVVILRGLNHLLQTCHTGAPTEYGQIEETIAPSALDLVKGWVHEVTSH